MSEILDESAIAAGRGGKGALGTNRGPVAPVTVAASGIPVINLGEMLSAKRSSPAWRIVAQQVASAIRTACHDTGFFYIANHGVPSSLVRAVLDANRDFHARPEAEKLALKVNAWLRGYQPMASTQMHSSARFKPAPAPNQLESFIISNEISADHPAFKKRAFVGPNQWPDDPRFRRTLETYLSATRSLGMSLLPAFSLAVGQAPEYFDTFFDPPSTTLRLVHYPPSPIVRPDDYLGIYPHTDYGFFTILAQDNVGGLEIQRIDGTWVEAPGIADAFIVNIGDAAARWSNDDFNSSPHRVINKSTEKDRYSVALFFDPNHDTIIRCLDGCVREGEAPKYAPISFFDYYRERMDSNHPDRRAADVPVN